VSLFNRKKEGGSPEPKSVPEVRPIAARTTPAAPPREPEAAKAGPPGEQRSMETRAPERVAGGNVANIGKSIVIKGDLSGEEDLVIDGKVEGKIQLPNNRLTVGQGGQVQAEVHAKSVVVVGRVAGNVNASERLEIHDKGIVEGDVKTPRLVVQDGAVLNGSVEMTSRPATQQPTSRPSSGAQPGASHGPSAGAGSSHGEARVS